MFGSGKKDSAPTSDAGAPSPPQQQQGPQAKRDRNESQAGAALRTHGPAAEKSEHGSGGAPAVGSDGSAGPDVSATAAAGLNGSPQPLPHLDTIQRSFGSHDVTGVQAFVGGPAADASAQLGANAYSTGGATAFAEPPSLHTAAHEAAHVVQQGSGVHLAGRVGSRGDGYEQHADRVADLVVRGESAESTLSEMAPAGARTGAAPVGAAVQRDQRPPEPDSKEQRSPLPRGLEAHIMNELDLPITRTQTRAQAERARRLVGIFRSIAPQWRVSLADRLAHPTRGDVLVNRIRGELHPQTVQLLLAALRGEAVTIPEADAIAGVKAAQLHVYPTSILLDSKFAPDTMLSLRVVAPEGPGVEGPPIQMHMRVEIADDPGEDPVLDEATWPAGIATPDKFVVRIDRAGRRLIRCDITQDGLLITTLTAEVDVQQTVRSGEEDKKQVEDVVAAIGIPEEQLVTGHGDRTRQLAEGGLSEDESTRLADERNVFEFAAMQRGVPLERNLDPGPNAIQVSGSLELSADPVFLRNYIEEAYVAGGWSAVDDIEQRIADDLDAGDPNDADDPMAWIRERQPILDAFREQKRLLRAELDTFVAGLGGVAKAEAIDHLRASRARVEAELERYGIYHPYGDPNNVDDGPEQATTADAERMAAAAAQLSANQRAMDELRARLKAANLELMIRNDGTGMTEVYAASEGMSRDETMMNATDEELARVVEVLDRSSAAAEAAHTTQIGELCEEFPFLATYKKDDSESENGTQSNVDANALGKLADVGSRTDALTSKSLDVLDKIDRTIMALDEGDLSVWAESRIMAMGMAAELVVPGSPRERAANEKIDHENSMSWSDWALLAVTFALVAVTLIPTGGSSALVGAAVVGAEVGLAVLSTYQAMEALKKYEIGMAATGTDYDKAKAIAADEPSLFWLAVDVVGAALDVGTAVAAFGKLAKLRKAVKPGITARELDEALAVVHAEANQARISAEGALRLEDEMRTAAGLTDEAAEAGDDLAGAAGKVDDVADLPGRTADEIGEVGDAASKRVAPRMDSRARVRPQDQAQLEQQLGAGIVFDDDLDDGVSIVGKVGDNGDVHIDYVRVGKNAVIADILAHRRTIARMTRYNGLVGKLRKMWDDFIALVGGKIDQNPFPAGTHGYNSFEEVLKLQGLIEERRAMLLASGNVDPRILEDEIAFLSGEVAKHEDIARGARETTQMSSAGILVERPEISATTQAALDAGYKLPPENPTHYYYRRSDTQPDVFELAVKPSAPDNVPSLHAEVVREFGIAKPTGAFMSGRPKRIATKFIKNLDDDTVVVAHVRKMQGFDDFAGSLVTNKLLSEEEVADFIVRARKAAGDEVTDESLRHAAKQLIKDEKLLPHLLDPNITQMESFKRMEKLLGPMGVADRGNLAELWYQSRFAKKSEHHVATAVTRTTEDGEEFLEDRVIDFFGENGIATEVKSGAGTIDHDQFDAYLDMANQQLQVGKGAKPVKGVTYVFTDTEGAIENLPWIAKQIRNRKLEIPVAVEAFDRAGRRHVLSTADAMDAFASKFGP